MAEIIVMLPDMVAIVLDLIALATRTRQFCHNFLGSSREAPESVRKIMSEVSSFEDELRALEVFISEHPEATGRIRDITVAGGLLDAARKTVEELLDLFGPNASNVGSAGRAPESLRDRFAQLSLREGIRIENGLEQKSSITLTLTRSLAELVPRVLNDINQKLDGYEKRKILKWLSPISSDMLTMHSEKKALQEPNTCKWMIRHLDWKPWLNGFSKPAGSRKFIWVHGIPGAGKTVLASYLIEQAAHQCHAQGYAYYYCLHSRAQDESVPLLRWILSQLCKQANQLIPTTLHEAYKSENILSVGDLLDGIAEISQQFPRVYIVVDAVDESRSRENLMAILTQIGTNQRFSRISLLFTSREEIDIERSIEEVKDSCVKISMSNKDVRNDIKTFVHAELTSPNNRAWRKWEADFLHKIEEDLVQAARGMLRWAVCQLDVLKRIRTRDGILEALRDLPQDVFSTYERILSELPERDQEFARTALALDTLKEICGCLITLSKLRAPPMSCFNNREEEQDLRKVALAHYTVKEYLFFPGTAKGPANFFALSEEIVSNIDLKVIFNGLQYFGIRGINAGRCRVTRYEEYCLKMTEQALSTRRTDILRNEDLRKLVFKSLAPDFQHLSYLRNQNGIMLTMRNNFPIWHRLTQYATWPASKRAGTLANLISIGWVDMAEKYIESCNLNEMRRAENSIIWSSTFKLKQGAAETQTETLLSFCIRTKAVKFMQLFIRHGAVFEQEPNILFTAIKKFYINDANGTRTHDILKQLLAACAKPDPKPSDSPEYSSPDPPKQGRDGFVFTPLQLAVYHLEQDWVETLLEEDADPRGKGLLRGEFPQEYGEGDLDTDDLQSYRALGQQTPLEICESTIPSWAHNPKSEAVRRARRNIRTLLERHGALKTEEEQAREEAEEEEVEEKEDDRIARPEPMVIDLISKDPEGNPPPTRNNRVAGQVASPAGYHRSEEPAERCRARNSNLVDAQLGPRGYHGGGFWD